MLVDMLGFGGRIGRLRFLFSSLALGAFTGAAILFVIFGASGRGVFWGPLLFCMAVIMPAAIWASLALQAKRIRDIGWRPLPLILGYWGVTLLDKLLGLAIPPLALHGGGTAIGLLMNVAMALALLFWPGNGESDFVVPRFGSSWRPPEPAVRAAAAPVAAAPAAPAPAGFGRRGLSRPA